MAKNDLSDLLVNPKSRPEPSRPESQKNNGPQPSRAVVTMLSLLSVAALALGGVLTYSLREQNRQAQAAAEQLAVVHQSLELINRRLAETSNEIASLQSRQEVTMQRVGVTQKDLKRAQALAVQFEEEQARSVAVLSEEISQKADTQQVATFKEEAGQKFDGVDEEISTVRKEVKDNQRELTQTLQELTKLGVRVTEQGNMIATTSGGLEELRRRGERDYVTFDIRKNQQARLGEIRLELRKADRKRQRANLRLYLDDRRVERKDINVNTPLNFYVGSTRTAYELVINEVQKDRINGYVSVPKGALPQGVPSLESPPLISLRTPSP